ncbi:hypothetical protein ACFYO0_09430 [Streptomyces sp. NPDC006365]|uniref:hypothetical protein n=1 Tax=Streptomyces sp. NPDC006365 TaxID=3364744 RepID=UPI0036BA3ADC
MAAAEPAPLQQGAGKVSGRWDGYMYLPSDLNPQDLLDSRYGAPCTLVLEGFTDPTCSTRSPAGA